MYCRAYYSAQQLPKRLIDCRAGDADELPYPDATPEQLRASADAFLAGVEPPTSLPPPAAPILPLPDRRNLLIASALPYVNNVPHLGNIIGCVLSADVFARFSRQRGHNVLFVCGTDEYGTATETKALAEGVSPKEICDKYHKMHADIYEWFGISFDFFGRTTSKEQTQLVQDIFWKLHSAGHVLTDTVSQLYCASCSKFLADRFVEGTCPLCQYPDCHGDQCDKCGRLINAVELLHPRCKVCGAAPSVRASEHLFLDLPRLQPLLLQHLERMVDSEQSLWTENAKRITREWISTGVLPCCITRDLHWGIPVPLRGFADKVFYCWFDVTVSYLSLTGTYTTEWRQWWTQPDKVEVCHFMAKDNVPFHSVIFPSWFLSVGESDRFTQHIIACEYLNYEDGKFSKSRGVGVFGNDAKLTGIDSDVWRFYLLYVRPETQDSSFSWDDLQLKNNSELLNNLGNFINRPLQFVKKYFGGRVPEIRLTDEDARFVHAVGHQLQLFVQRLERAQLRDGIRRLLAISRYGNQYMQLNKPWVLMRQQQSPEQLSRAGSVVALAANVACQLGLLLHPYMPATSQRVLRQCGLVAGGVVPISLPFRRLLPSGHVIGQPEPLFAKIEHQLVASFKAKFAGDS